MRVYEMNYENEMEKSAAAMEIWYMLEYFYYLKVMHIRKLEHLETNISKLCVSFQYQFLCL